jgi:hypothetical protein
MESRHFSLDLEFRGHTSVFLKAQPLSRGCAPQRMLLELIADQIIQVSPRQNTQNNGPNRSSRAFKSPSAAEEEHCHDVASEGATSVGAYPLQCE